MPEKKKPKPKLTLAQYLEMFEQTTGRQATPEEAEFGLAVENYRRLEGRPFPACHELLGILVALGYRKVAPPGPHDSDRPLA